jgi:23S rRNA (pseudouridine1915-N3)-methyltransferase
MIKIVTVGKLTQSYLKTGIDYYEKQIKHKINWIEVSDEPLESGIDKEGERILKHIFSQDHVIVLSIQGHQMDSISFAKKIDQLMTYMQKDIVFVIGGSHGLSNDVYQRANEAISFSPMTFPHQLMRLILIEQIYRAMMILKNHPYHK